ncbi:hypothetical protein CDL12_02924 [Handroanthus impetiginosus]|uniref:Exostosin GT47 domain-containing protein n=1 Tax=Handroanthus impetiginosus TaxID=429701 RepID=A0A2G9I3Q8_9LAMI|nr:hypothetical protein CDL12_02924 [Handroanthus impetiginosus]
MDNHKPRSKFWFVFFILFSIWFSVLYCFDWSSLPGLSSFSQKSLQSLDSNPIQESSDPNPIPKSDDVPHDKNQTMASDANHKPNNVSTMDDTIENLERLQVKEEEEEENGVEKGRTRKFNDDYIKSCKLLNKWHHMCPYFDNMGLGQKLGNPQRLFSPIFVPYYSGLDISRYLFDSYNTSIKDADSLELFRLLKGKPEWNVMNGRDHFLVCGRITWDFRRAVDTDSEWGNKLMILPESQSITMLTIESSPWDKNDFAIPYPTYFHPSNDDQVYERQNKMRRQRRRTLFCFAGAPRPNMDGSIRGEIMAQCTAARQKCKMMECKNDKHNCLKPVNVMKMFQNSVFCLQPPGDSFTRRSTFDSILAGCIPVFFTPGSAYVQYLWHLPKEYSSYSVLIPEGDVKQKKVSIDNVLSKISKSRVSEMREQVIKLIPKVIYADPRSRLNKLEDAFDLTVKGVIERVDKLKRDMREGRSYGDEFDSESSWKYYTFGTTEQHEWDHYFKRN